MEGLIGIIIFIIALNIISYLVRRQRARSEEERRQGMPSDLSQRPAHWRDWEGKREEDLRAVEESMEFQAPTARETGTEQEPRMPEEVLAPWLEEMGEMEDWEERLFGPLHEAREPEEGGRTVARPLPPERMDGRREVQPGAPPPEPPGEAPPRQREEVRTPGPMHQRDWDEGISPANEAYALPSERSRACKAGAQPSLYDLLTHRGIRHGIVLTEILKPPLARRHYRQ